MTVLMCSANKISSGRASPIVMPAISSSALFSMFRRTQLFSLAMPIDLISLVAKCRHSAT